MKELIEFIAKSLVDDPTQVSVTEDINGSDIVLELRVGPGDMGRVIGRQGKVINAMRTLAQMCAAREAKRAHLELLED